MLTTLTEQQEVNHMYKRGVQKVFHLVSREHCWRLTDLYSKNRIARNDTNSLWGRFVEGKEKRSKRVFLSNEFVFISTFSALKNIFYKKYGCLSASFFDLHDYITFLSLILRNASLSPHLIVYIN